MSILGLDVGTTGCRVLAFDERGHVLARVARDYGVDSPRAGWAEQDAETVWSAALSALDELVVALPGDPPVAIGLSVQGEAVVPVDAAGRPLRPVILGMDTRTGVENGWIEERLGGERIRRMTGMPVHTINTLPKLLWLRTNEPATWGAAHRFLLYEDLLALRLTGVEAISHCLASRTQLYDLQAGRWAPELLEAAGIDASRLSPLAEGAIGRLRPELTERLGLSVAPLVVLGGHDQACAALGSGAVAAGQAMVSTGTAEVIEVALDGPDACAALGGTGISVYRHVVPGLFLAMTLNHSGGLLLRWFRDTFCEPQCTSAGERGEDAYDLILAEAKAGPSGLLVLPHLTGSGTPWLDTSSRAAICGLSLSTDRGAVAKGIVEGLTHELRINLDILRAAGIPVTELRAVGGGARSPLWLQLKADLLGLPIRMPAVSDAAALGAALLAGVAAGLYRDPAEAVEAAVRVEATHTPDTGAAAAYEPFHALYRRLYPAVREIQRELGDLTASAAKSQPLSPGGREEVGQV